jgi:3-oxoacyl-[acyl-carrier-protein] synthase-1
MFVVSTGMACSVGLSAAAACAAMRAGIAKFDALPYHDNQGEPIIGASVPGLEPGVKRERRLIEILGLALVDCLGEKPAVPPSQVPLLVGLAEEGRPGGGAAMADTILADVQAKLGWKFHPTLSRAIPKGHTAGLEALRMVRELFQDPGIPACLVCGVDSYINANTLRWLDQNWRLKTPANPHGLIPGEAAAAVLLQRASVDGAAVEVIGLGFGKETAHVLSEEPLLGLGLTDAARAALAEAKLGFHEMDWRISDVNGEQYGFKELPLVEGRLVRVVRKEAQPLWHCADSIGDSGAAAGVAQLVVADRAFRKGYAPGETAICLSSSVPGDRAAAVVRRATR